MVKRATKCQKSKRQRKLPTRTARAEVCPRVTQRLIGFVEVIEEDIVGNSGAIATLRSQLLKGVIKLNMNEVELAAWACVLLRLLQPGACLESNLSDLMMSAYHTKSLLCQNMTPYYVLSISEDSLFPEKYLQWLEVHPGLHIPSLEELHRRQKSMSMRCEDRHSNQSYNVIVDSLVEAKEGVVEERNTAQWAGDGEENNSEFEMNNCQPTDLPQFCVKLNDEDCTFYESSFHKEMDPPEICDFNLDIISPL